jgi:hypothetical protein
MNMSTRTPSAGTRSASPPGGVGCSADRDAHMITVEPLVHFKLLHFIFCAAGAAVLVLITA